MEPNEKCGDLSGYYSSSISVDLPNFMLVHSVADGAFHPKPQMSALGTRHVPGDIL